jgi:hypothetical protein
MALPESDGGFKGISLQKRRIYFRGFWKQFLSLISILPEERAGGRIGLERGMQGESDGVEKRTGLFLFLFHLFGDELQLHQLYGTL